MKGTHDYKDDPRNTSILIDINDELALEANYPTLLPLYTYSFNMVDTDWNCFEFPQ